MSGEQDVLTPREALALAILVTSGGIDAEDVTPKGVRGLAAELIRVRSGGPGGQGAGFERASLLDQDGSSGA